MGLLDRLLRVAGLDFTLDLESGPFDRITPGLFLGARPGPETVAAMQAAGITGVVSCLPERERGAMRFLEAEFQTWFLPVQDGMHEDIRPGIPLLAEALAAVGADGGVLVHCEVGVSRSATLAIAHVMGSTDHRFYEAYQAVRARRPQVLPNIGFASQLQAHEHSLHPPLPAGELSSLARYLVDVARVPVDAEPMQAALQTHGFDAYDAIRSLFDGEIPRVVQGVRRA